MLLCYLWRPPALHNIAKSDSAMATNRIAFVTTLLLIVFGVVSAIRPPLQVRSETSRSSAKRNAAIRWAVTAFGSKPRGIFESPEYAARAKQRDFCLSGQAPFMDTATNFVRYPVAFQNLSFSVFCYAQQDLVSNQILRAGSWEEDTSKNMLDTMQQACDKLDITKDKAVFLDIGANIGWFSLLFAAAGHSVIAFEPMKSNEQLLRRSLCSNAGFQQRVAYYTDMLSDAEHENCTLFSGIDNLGDGTVTCDQQFIAPENYTVQDSGLQMTSVDIVLATLDRPVLMVKMDVEGYEGHVFQGAVKTIIQARVPFIVFEFSYAWVKQSGRHPDMLIERLSEAGYQFSFDSFQGAPFDPVVYFADPEVEQADLTNIFCVHESMLL